jgi:hypothetical protein
MLLSSGDTIVPRKLYKTPPADVGAGIFMQISGDDRIVARRLYKEPLVIKPAVKKSAVNKIVVDDSDDDVPMPDLID